MKYYVVDSISGCKDGVRAMSNLERAKAKRDKLNADDKAKGHPGTLWTVVDEDGKEVE